MRACTAPSPGSSRPGCSGWARRSWSGSRRRASARPHPSLPGLLNASPRRYFSEGPAVRCIDPGLPAYIAALRQAGVKVALDTGYPPEIQGGLISALGLGDAVDGWVSSYDVEQGRPYPYMVHRLMERLGVMDVRRVAKVGDSARDMEMGRNAGCGLVVGVLSGADSEQELFAAGADVVVGKVTDLPVPVPRRRRRRFTGMDLS